MDEKNSFWKGAAVIHCYSRSQALEDGVLADITSLAKEAGFKFPMAATAAVWNLLSPSEDLQAQGQSFNGRAWDMLSILKLCIGRWENTDIIRFAPLFITKPGAGPEPVRLWAKCGPGDTSEPVVTIMMEGED